MQMPRFAYAFDFAAICSTFGISYSWPHMAKSKEKKGIQVSSSAGYQEVSLEALSFASEGKGRKGTIDGIYNGIIK